MCNTLRQVSRLQGIASPRCFFATLIVGILALAPASRAQSLAKVPASAPTTGSIDLATHTPLQVMNGSAPFLAHYDPTKMLRLAIILAAPHPVEEAKFLDDLQDRQSPLFHQYLSSQEWDARFGPTPTSEQAVVDWATSQGFNITYRFDNRMVVDVEAPAGVIEQALHVSINNYRRIGRNGEDDQALFSNDRDPVLPSSVRDTIRYIEGLNSFERPQPAIAHGRYVPGPDYVPGPAYARMESARADATPQDLEPAGLSANSVALSVDTAGDAAPGSSPSSSFYAPTDVWGPNGYDYLALMNQGHCCNPLGNADNSPPESSIAIAAYGDVSFEDVAAFKQGFPYIAYNLQKFLIDGGPSACVNTPKLSEACSETTLDTEWSLSTANSKGSAANTAKIYIYEGGAAVDVYNQILKDKFAKVFSTSWSCGEVEGCSVSYMDSTDIILASMVGQGFTLVGDSGDQGATGNCDDGLYTRFPASDPNVVAAGGATTQMWLDPVTEVAWTGSNTTGSCGSNGGGSTGGQSVLALPSYQSKLGYPKRAVPDLALNASIGQNVYYDGMWLGYGGTSIVAPELAGFFAQENAYLLSLGKVCGSNNDSVCGPLGNPNYAIYDEAYRHVTGHVPFYDITTGCNSNDITVKYDLKPFCAGNGFDEVTGWGSANMLQLAWTLNWESTPANGLPSTTFAGPATNKWYNTNQNVSWTIADYAGGGSLKGTGIAGFTQGWDSIPADATTEPRGSGTIVNSFYSGPQYPNAKTGCLALASGESCSGGVSQGCHTAHVRGWNNQGYTTGDSTYGPICYDTVAPTVQISVTPNTPAGGWFNAGVVAQLYPVDAGGGNASGIAKTYYATNGTACSTTSLSNCQVYSKTFTLSAQGNNDVTFFTQDNAGNFSSVNNVAVKIDTTPPVTTASYAGTLDDSFYISTVTITLKATDNLSGVSATYYTLDGGGTIAYLVPIVVASLGEHILSYWSVDVAGNKESGPSTLFVIYSPTTTTLTAPATATAGSTVTLSAVVKPSLSGTPTGTVTFSNGSTSLGTATLSGGMAILNTTALPTGTDTLTAAYNFSSDYLSSTSAAVMVKVTPAGNQITVTPGSLTFASTAVGSTTAAQLITIENNGTTAVTLNGNTIGGMNPASFLKSATTCVSPLAAGASCTNSIEFTPTLAGSLTAVLTVNTSAAGTAPTVALSGTATAASGPVVVVTPSSLTFMSTAGITTPAQVITIKNTGTTPITLNGNTFTGSGAGSFIKSATTCVSPLAAGASCTNSIAFDPTAAGSFSASLSVNTSAPGSPTLVPLTGTATTAGGVLVTATPGSLTFTAAVGATSASQVVTIKNIGSTPLTLDGNTFGGTGAGSFIKSATTCISPLAAGASCTNSIEFSPSAAGTVNAVLNVNTSAPGTPPTVALAGTGN